MSEEKKEKFVLLNECLAGGTISTKKYRSQRTGLTVIVADVPGPLVSGNFFVATEALDDDGLPHTLEHLIFLGSADYPYKGTLDICANRCLADGTNAWTDIDHTAYTVSTAGSEGFLNLLPIYLDHLFFPTLTDSGFVTEVYHITGEGKDSGVVFCEMQGYEGSSSEITGMELLRAMYKKNSGYRYEIGGAVHNLRYSTSNEKVRKFHQAFYCPLNTTLIVAGFIDVDKLLETCYEFENKLSNKASNMYVKAWQSPVELLEKSVIRGVTYPCDEEDSGCVNIGWQGPSYVTEYYKFAASVILFNYLSKTSASPLVKYFVEVNDPYCSDVSVSVIENSVPAFSLEFENVAISKIPYIHEELMNLLNVIVEDKDESYRITRSRMISVIEKNLLEKLLALEKDPQTELAKTLIRDTLYGQSTEDMADKLNIEKLTSNLLKEPTSFWISILKDYFVQRPSATVLGYPWKNEKLLRTLLEDERLSRRKVVLGEEGLKQKAEILKNAVEENNVGPPDELISTVPVPLTIDLKFHSINRYTTDSKEQHPHFNISASPIYTQLDDVDSKFVYTYIVLDTRKLRKELRPYLSLLLEYISSCPINRGGQIISPEQVAAELEEDVVTMNNSIGLFCDDKFTSGPYSYLVLLSVVTTLQNYEKGVTWMRSLLYDSVFTSERLLVTVQKVMNSISLVRRRGPAMLKCLSQLMMFDHDNHRTNTVLSQLCFLANLMKKLENEHERSSVIRDLEEIRSILTSSENMILHLSTSVKELVEKFENPAEVLSRIIPENSIRCQKRFEVQQDHEFLSSAMSIQRNEIQSCVVGMGSDDSSFMQHATKSITDFDHPDLPALVVCIQYFVQLEGPLWRNIRGLGLAYGYNIQLNANEGVLLLSLYRSSDIVQAFRKTKEVMLDTILSNEWNHVLFESSKGSLVFKAVNREKNIASVSRQSLLSHFYNTPGDYNRNLIRKIRDVNISEMKNVANKYLLPLFDPKISLSTIVCHTSEYKKVSESFAKLGHELVAFPTLEDSYLSSSFIMSTLTGRC